MDVEDDEPLSELFQQVGNKAGWFDENGDISASFENLSLRVKHGGKKKAKDKIVTKTKTPKVTTKKSTKLMDMSEDDFESEKRLTSKKPKPSSFSFTSPEEMFPSKPQPSTSRKKSSEDSENQPPSMKKTTKKTKSVKKKAVMKKLVSFSSEDELSTELEIESVKPKADGKSTPASKKQGKATKNTPVRTPKTVPANNPTTSATPSTIQPESTRTPSKVQSSNEPSVAKCIPQSSLQEVPSLRQEGRLYPNLDALKSTNNNPEQLTSKEADEARHSPQNPSPPMVGLYPNLTELMKKPKPRISIGAKGYETIIHSPKHVKMSRLSTNSNISTIDIPIAESTAYVELEPSPNDSYLARPMFQALTEPQGSSQGSEKVSTPRKVTEPLTSQDLALELTITQPDSAPVVKSSNSVPSSEYRGRSELTQVAWKEDDRPDGSSEEEACKTIVSATTSESKSSENKDSTVSGPQVIEESSLSSKPKDSSGSLFSTKQESTSDQASTDRSVGSLNLSSYIKGKKLKPKKRKKSVKHLLIEPDLSSDDDRPLNKQALLEESRLMLKAYGSDESELPFPLTQNHRGYVPNSQHSEDVVSPSRNVYDDVRVSETDSSTKVVPDSECNFVPESQSVEVVKDSQETVDTRFECVPDSEALSSPYGSTQATQDTVIRVPTQNESSVDNATTMFIKARSKYVGEVDGCSSPRHPAQSPKSATKSTTKSATKNSATSHPIEESQNLSQVVSATKLKSRRNITLELVESLDDPEELQATIHLLSQKLESILSAKKQKGSKQSSQNLSERNRGDGAENSFRLQQRDFQCNSDSPQSPQRSFNELCVKSKAQGVQETENQANVSLQCSLPTSTDKETMHDDTVGDAVEPGTEQLVSPAQSIKSMCSVSLQCSMLASPLNESDKSMPISEEETEEEQSPDNVMYRTAVGDDLKALEEQEYLTDDESFEKQTSKPPSPPFHLKNAISVERVKTILSDSKLRRRSTQVQMPRKVLSLDSHNSDKEGQNGGDDDDELPDILNPPRATITSWRTTLESCPSPESPRSQTESSEEEEMENFFSKMRRPTPRKEPVMSLNDFIVDDDDVTSDEEEDEEVFHVRTDNTQKRRQKPGGIVLSSDDDFDDTAFTDDDDGDDNDDSVFEVDKQNEPRNSPLFKTPSLPPLRKKAPSSAPRADPSSSRVTTTTSASDLMTTPVRPTPRVLPNTTGHAPTQYASFLRSLGTFDEGTREARHPDAAKYIKNFHKYKEELSARLFTLYNSTVFESKLPEDMEIKWNSRLLKTAGFCAYKRSSATQANRRVRIELSVKVCDSSERVRDTLIHEMCHAAVWIVHGVNDGHGPYWKHWAHKANRIHSDLPVIKRCHSYSIQTKYIYKCTSCGYEVGRHSKSLNTDTKVCGYCRSPFQLLVNSQQGKRKTPPTPATPRTPNKFALFVKENYKTLKEQNQASNHKEVMALLSAEFAKTKVSS